MQAVWVSSTEDTVTGSTIAIIGVTATRELAISMCELYHNEYNIAHGVFDFAATYLREHQSPFIYYVERFVVNQPQFSVKGSY
jgi:hypothetical protein